MDYCWDFIQYLGTDVSINVLVCLDDPSDLARVCSVSSSWRKFVIENSLSKHLCVKMFPELSSITHVIEANNMIDPIEVRPDNSSKWEILERDHKVYAFLSRGLTFVRKDCISESISASSTDNFPEENIQNTLEPRDRVEGNASYWSSQGASDPSIPEILLYKLVSKLCVITEVNLQPFQAYFQIGFPIYSAKAVRFRMGHYRSQNEVENKIRDESTEIRQAHLDDFVWTYTSPEFPMAQENCLQNFKLPEPGICIGGILAVELLGRVQRQEMDSLYYVCISHVQVVGRSLSPAFNVDIISESGKCTLKYNPGAEHRWSPTRFATNVSQSESPSTSSSFQTFATSIRIWEQMFLNTLLGDGGVVVGEDDDEDEIGDDNLEDDDRVA